MQSTLTLYLNCKILPQRTFMVDDIEAYLDTLTKIEIENYQYQKFDFDMVFKIDKSQTTQEFTELNNYNYAKIVNDAGKAVYFFIVSKKPRAESTIAIHAIMDTINTFRPGVDFDISSRTHVLRQHKDRFIVTGKRTIIAGQVLLDASNFSEEGFGEYNYHYYSRVSVPVDIFYLISDIEVSSQQPLQDQVLNAYFNREEKRLYIELWSEQSLSVYYTIAYILRTVSSVRRNIDYFSEGLTPLLYKRESVQLNQENNQNWFLVYRNQNAINPNNFNEVNPVECFVVPENETEIKTKFQPIEIDFSSLSLTYLYLSYNLNGYETTYQVLDSNDEEIMTGNLFAPYIIGNSLQYEYLEISKDLLNSDIVVRRMMVTTDIPSGVKVITELSFPKHAAKVVVYNIISTLKGYATPYQVIIENIDDMVANRTFTQTMDTTKLKGLDSIDRTDAQLIKIIELPYCPLEEIDGAVGGYFTVDSYNGTSMKLVNPKQKFSYNFTFDVDTPFKPIRSYSKDFSINDLKDIENESKLYHSDYYQPKFAYDSFGKSFNLEKIDYETYMQVASSKFLVRYTVTSTINSRFSFIFPDYKLFLSTEDFDNVVAVARNNEIPLYTSQYINYLRTGFNYDVKSKDITKTNAIMSAGASVVGSIGSIALAVASENPFAVASAIFTTAHAVTSIVSSVNTIAASEASFEAKQLQMRNQAISVAGSDDVDIMESYSGNRAYLNTYRVSDRLRNALYELFFYTGYSTDEFGDINMNSRSRFNFISCDLVMQQGHNVPDYALTDLVSKYRYLTIIHHFNNEWDFEQTYENWEVSLGG